MGKFGRNSILAAFVSLLAACGGADNIGNSAASPTAPVSVTCPAGQTANANGVCVATTTPTTPTTPAAAAVATVTLLANTTQLPSDASTAEKGVKLTATVIDVNNNIVQGASVKFAVDNQGVLAVTQAISDVNGNAFATLTTPTSKANRTLNVKATASGIDGVLTVQVVGTNLSSAGPDSLAAGQQGRYTVTLLDAGGKAIGGQAVTVSAASGGTLSATSLTTDSATGQATVNLKAASGTSETITFTALGLSTSKQIVISNDQFRILPIAAELDLNTNVPVTIEWLRGGSAADTSGKRFSISATRGTVSPTSGTLDANGRATVQINSSNAGGVLIEASSVDLTKPSASITSEFVAKSVDLVDVQFDPTVIPINSQSTVIATVRDTAGNLVKNVRVSFTLQDVTNGSLSTGSAVTNSQGRATVIYRSSSSQSSNEGVKVTASATRINGTTVSSQAALTVGSGALRITLGTGNEVLIKNQTQYQLPYAIIVTDAAGNAAASAQARLQVQSTGYGKGQYQAVDTNDDGTPDKLVPIYSARCENEDNDLDGVLDAGEDFNANGKLEPSNVVSLPSTVTLDGDGSAQFNLTYPKDRANWVSVKLRASVNASGSEGFEEVGFLLPVSKEDVSEIDSTPPGAVSPYGTASTCSDPD